MKVSKQQQGMILIVVVGLLAVLGFLTGLLLTQVKQKNEFVAQAFSYHHHQRAVNTSFDLMSDRIVNQDQACKTTVFDLSDIWPGIIVEVQCTPQENAFLLVASVYGGDSLLDKNVTRFTRIIPN